ncbi:hypothetical protein N657DRAFT_636961 [Parathielavia appendiculata]|uniref:Uncharacterized protein n=1 Tax=Parathielavia appendiculata TaxID=2587402 RepID=A0AAN6Z0W9_9PEZI|nr:hypothetical protein N657DRAFT_636961 [Parathielavia appendiculata]
MSTILAAAAGAASEENQGPERHADHNFNTKLDIIKAEVQLEFRKLRNQIAEEVAKTTAQLTQEFSQAREDLNQARSKLEHTRLQLHAVTGSQGAAHSYPGLVHRSGATPEPTFYTVDVLRVPEEHAGETTSLALRKLVEKEMQAPGDQPSWRVVGRNKEELKKIKDILEAKKSPVDNVNRTAVIDHKGKVLLGAAEALGQEDDVQIAKLAWLSRKDSAKAYGSMVVYVTKASDARRLLDEGFVHAGGESGYTRIFERRIRPEQCYNCQQI